MIASQRLNATDTSTQLVSDVTRVGTNRFCGLSDVVLPSLGLPPQIPATTLRASLPVFAGIAQVGYASSSTWSPVLKKYIALAHIKKPHFATGADLLMEVTVEHQRKYAPAKVVKTPFYEPEWKKK